MLVSGPVPRQLTLNADGQFTYTPAANYNGPDSFTYKATTARPTATSPRSRSTSRRVNDAPVARNDAYSTDEDTRLRTATGPDQRQPTSMASPERDLVSGPRTAALTLNPERLVHLHAGRQLQRPGQLHLQGQRRPGRQQRRHRLDHVARQRCAGGANDGVAPRGHAG
jgi:hypothetical protein